MSAIVRILHVMSSFHHVIISKSPTVFLEAREPKYFLLTAAVSTQLFELMYAIKAKCCKPQLEVLLKVNVYRPDRGSIKLTNAYNRWSV